MLYLPLIFAVFSTLGLASPLNLFYNNPYFYGDYGLGYEIQQAAGLGGGLQDTCPKASRCVQEFAQTFIRGIQANYRLSDAFSQRRLTAEEAGRIYNYLVSEISKELGGGSHRVPSRILSEAVRKNFDRITPSKLIRNYATNTGQALEVLGVLGDGNAARLGKQFLLATKKRVDAEPRDSNAEMQVESLTQGFVDFLRSIGQFKKENEAVFATLFAQEWYKL